MSGLTRWPSRSTACCALAHAQTDASAAAMHVLRNQNLPHLIERRAHELPDFKSPKHQCPPAEPAVTFSVPYNVGSMIAHLRGTLLAKHPNQAILETAGVGYDVTISVPTFSDLPELGSEVALHIHTHVREDTIALYGFLRSPEKMLFEKLISVSGIGPKLAITILSGMAADDMVGAIRGNDVARLTRIPGVGKKTAERMVLELRDKLPQPTPAAPALPALTATEEDVLSALLNLGYQRASAEKAVATVAKTGSFDAMFRDALAALTK
jgi:Holliday junction DNA helicase RuvA